jgi:hypothetical protein
VNRFGVQGKQIAIAIGRRDPSLWSLKAISKDKLRPVDGPRTEPFAGLRSYGTQRNVHDKETQDLLYDKLLSISIFTWALLAEHSPGSRVSATRDLKRVS